MKQMGKMLLHRGQFPVLITLGIAPIVLVLYTTFAPALLATAWVFPVAYVLLTVVGLPLPGKWRVYFGILGAAAFAAGGVLLYRQGVGTYLLAVPAAFGGLFLWSLKMGSWDSREEPPFFWSWFGIVVHVGAQVVIFFAGKGDSSYDPILPWLGPCFFGYMLLVMLSLMRSTLSSAAREKQSAPVSMKRKNMLLVVAVFAIAMLIAMLPSLVEAVRGFFQWVIDAFISWLENAPPLEYMDAEVENNGTGNMLDELYEPTEESLFSRIFGLILRIAVFALLAAVAVYLLYRLLRWLIRYLKKLGNRLSHYVAAVSEDYEDEISDTREGGTKSRREKRKMSRAMLSDDPDLPPALRIRRNFLRLRLRHREWPAGTTAREKLPGELAALYEQARYSDHPVSGEDAAKFAADTRKM